MSKFHHRVIGFLMMFGIALAAGNDQHTQLQADLVEMEKKAGWESRGSEYVLDNKGSAKRFMKLIIEHVDFKDQCNQTQLNLSQKDRKLVLNQFEEQWNEYIGSMGSMKLTRNLNEIMPHPKKPMIKLKYYMTSTSTDNKTGKTLTTQSTIPVVLEVPDNSDKGFDVKIKEVDIGGSKVDLVEYMLSKNITGLGKVTICDALNDCVKESNCSTHPFFADDKKASSEEAIK